MARGCEVTKAQCTYHVAWMLLLTLIAPVHSLLPRDWIRGKPRTCFPRTRYAGTPYLDVWQKNFRKQLCLPFSTNMRREWGHETSALLSLFPRRQFKRMETSIPVQDTIFPNALFCDWLAVQLHQICINITGRRLWSYWRNMLPNLLNLALAWWGLTDPKASPASV